MSYEVTIEEGAFGSLARLGTRMRRRIFERIEALAGDPRPPGSEALRGDLQGLRRIRVGDYRVSYHVSDAAGLVTVIEVGHRRGIYQRLRRKR